MCVCERERLCVCGGWWWCVCERERGGVCDILAHSEKNKTKQRSENKGKRTDERMCSVLP